MLPTLFPAFCTYHGSQGQHTEVLTCKPTPQTWQAVPLTLIVLVGVSTLSMVLVLHHPENISLPIFSGISSAFRFFRVAL